MLPESGGRDRRPFGAAAPSAHRAIGAGRRWSLLAALLLLGSVSAQAQMTTGSYVGNGAAGRAITGLGFRPDVVIIKVDYSDAAPNLSAGVIRTSTMVGDLSKPMRGSQALLANLVQSLDANGFTVGNDERVNWGPGLCGGANCTYYWVAFKADRNLKLGTYTGNDATQAITGLGFSPEYVLVISANARPMIQRPSAGTNTYTLDNSTPPLTTQVTSLDANGFTVTHDPANPFSNASTIAYHYVAWNEVAGQVKVGSYVGNGVDNRNILGVGFGPRYMLARVMNDIQATTQRFGVMFGDASVNFGNAVVANRLQGFQADGFQVGTDVDVNAAAGACAGPSDCNYFYVAFGANCCTLTTTQAGGVVTVETSEAKMVWEETAQGGGLSEFYAKNEPNPTVNRASDELAYNLISTQVNDNTPVANTWHFEDSGNGRLDVLEATPTRVRLRQSYSYTTSIHLRRDFTVQGYPRLGIREDLTLDSAQSIRGAQGLHAAAPAACPSAGTFYCNGRPNPSPVAPPPAGLVYLATDESATYSDMLGIPYTSPFFGRGGGAAGEFQASWEDHDPGAPYTFFSRVWESTQIATAAGTDTRYNLYYPMLPGLTSTGTEYQPYADDYRTPSVLSVSVGAPWNDASENTAADNFNEAEASYDLTMHDTSGLTFQISGSGATPRRRPLFKIRNWRSLVQANVTLDPDGGGPSPATTLLPSLDYRSDVKPISHATFLKKVIWYSTLQNPNAITASPDIGNVETTTIPAGNFVAARFGQGATVTAAGTYISIAVTDGAGAALPDFDKASGGFEYWYQPTWPSTDNNTHDLAGLINGANNEIDFQKLNNAGGNNLLFRLRANGVNSDCQVSGATYSWSANEWVHLRVEWDETAPAASQQRIYINGSLKPCTATPTDYVAATLNLGTNGAFWVGNINNGANVSGFGVYDELYFYGGSSAPATRLAAGGLTADSSEYLADSSKNFQLTFTQRDALQRGEYLYLGVDSKFSGINVALLTKGVQSIGPLNFRIQYWSGIGWSTAGDTNPATAGITDTTASLTQNGSIHWADAQVAGWQPYSINGGPDLYFVRISLQFGAYLTPPTESMVKSDILLLQYCGDIASANQEFHLLPPATTAVTLESFAAIGLDSAVELRWQTASELQNLGFHVYRSLSADGPWTRLTSSLIPGLGSSALGQAYSWRDTGLTNGTLYFYRLEDVDSASKATSHGPVSAVPQAAVPGAGNGNGPAKGGDKKQAAAPSCPAWVQQAYGAAVGADAATAVLSCTRHGEPEAVSLGVVSRDARSATLELRTGGFYALHTLAGAGEATGPVRVFVPGFDFPKEDEAAALPIRRALIEAVVGRKVQLGGVRALELESFRGLVPSALGKAEIQVGRDGTVRAARRAEPHSPRLIPKRELVTLLPSQFQGEAKTAVVEIAPLRYDAQHSQLLLAKRVLVRLLFTGREAGESGRGSVGRARVAKAPTTSGEVLARLYTAGLGLHAVSFEQLFPGQSRSVAVSQLRLERQGAAVGFHVEPASTSFGPGSRLYFHAERATSPTDFSSELAYELLRSRDGVPMALVSAVPGSSGVTTASLVTRSFEVNRFYQPGLLAAPDPWLWEAVASGATRVKPFTLTGVVGSGSAQLDVYLQGASESGSPVDHHLSLSLNGTLVGEAQFAGKQAYRMSLSLPASLLREGSNEISLTNVADTGMSSLVFLDRFTVTHPQTSALTNGVFEGTWGESGAASVSGVTGSAALVDVTAGARWLSGYQASGGSVRFQAEAGHRYLVVSQPLGPRVAPVVASTLRSPTNQADYILIAPQGFLAVAEPLLERRQDQGLTTRAVSLEEIAAEFGHGQASAEAIKAFLAYAYQSWSRLSPRYVLLLGDASYDPRNFMGSSLAAPLPALWTKTSYLWTASDPLLAAVNGDDDLPDLAIGRLPATTLDEAKLLVQKLLDWEDSGQGLSGPAALVADNPDLAGDFEANVEDIRQSFLASRETRVLKLSELGALTRPAIQDALNSGLSFLSYVGHGGAAVWASENVWNSWDAPSLQAQSRQPLLVTMNCLNGYFVAPSYDSLAESLLKADGRGAIAAFSPSGLSLDGPAHQYQRALLAELTSGTHERLGDAILAAQKAYAQTGLMPELLDVYHLFGDPATRIR